MYEFACDQCPRTAATPIEPAQEPRYCVGCDTEACGHLMGPHEVWCFNAVAHTPPKARRMELVATPKEVVAA